MDRRRWPLAAVAAVLLVAACHEQPTPTEVQSPGIPMAATYALGCSFSELDRGIERYFGWKDEQKAEYLAKALRHAYQSHASSMSQAAGFDLLEFLAAVADAGRGSSTEDGSKVANATLACMKIGFTSPVDFSGAFEADGFFGIRGRDAGATSPAITRDGFAGVAPPATGWAAWVGGGTVIYGQLVETFDSNEQVIFAAVDWSIIQAAPGPLNGVGEIGLCVDNPDDAFRIQEDHILLPLSDPLFLGCATLASRAPTPTTLAGRVLRTMSDWFRPAPLFAAMARGGTGGTAGGFSPFGVVHLGAVNPGYRVQPTDVAVGTVITPAVEVVAAGNGGTGIPGVSVTIHTVLNNGKPLALLGTTTVVTGSDGVARFDDLVLTKPGVVILEATSTTPGYPAAVLRSERFHVKPK